MFPDSVQTQRRCKVFAALAVPRFEGPVPVDGAAVWRSLTWFAVPNPLHARLGDGARSPAANSASAPASPFELRRKLRTNETRAAAARDQTNLPLSAARRIAFADGAFRAVGT